MTFIAAETVKYSDRNKDRKKRKRKVRKKENTPQKHACLYYRDSEFPTSVLFSGGRGAGGPPRSFFFSQGGGWLGKYPGGLMSVHRASRPHI